MLSKAPAVLLSSSPGFAARCSLCSPSRHGHPPHYYSPQPQTRQYAQQARNTREPPDTLDLTWPEAEIPHETPTPYQILAVRRGDVYTKHRFYALAKLYHPDRCHASSPIAHVPHAIRLERYRLLVTAHGILSDDTKRRAYDLWGSGWAGHRGHSSSATSWPADDSPMNNATWEDWERWHQRGYGRGEQTDDPRAVYMSNFGFMSLILAFIALGGVVQGTRANTLTASVMERRDKVHEEASMELARSKRATMTTGDRNERIRTFLQHREANLPGDGAYQHLSSSPDECAPDTVRKK
jgi:curved DNA-binding protein CbpA